MRRQTTLMLALLIIVTFWLVAWGGDGPGDKRTTYEIRPSVSVPVHRSDTVRAIDAYERLMDRYMDLIQTNMVSQQTDTQDIKQRLVRMEALIVGLDQKLNRIETALNTALSPQ